MSERMNIKKGTPPGQKPLLSRTYCDCPGDLLEAMKEPVLKVLIPVINRTQCPVGASQSMLLIVAALVNPVNVNEASRGQAREAARAVAEMMEEVARGIRLRASE